MGATRHCLSGKDENNDNNNSKSVTEGAEKRAFSYTVSGSINVDDLSGGQCGTTYRKS